MGGELIFKLVLISLKPNRTDDGNLYSIGFTVIYWDKKNITFILNSIISIYMI